jgi:pimeloyl-ACP methyl ester carboxylesterase
VPESVKSRQVTYFHGFDPASTQRYRRIFDSSAERLVIESRDLPDAEGWQAHRGEASTNIHIARYADQVRAWQDWNMPARLGRGIRSVLEYLLDGSGLRITRAAPRAAMLAVSPILATLLPFALVASTLEPSGPVEVGVLLAFGLALLMLAKRTFLLLVSDLFAFYREIAKGTSPTYEDYRSRLAELTGNIPTGQTDERIIVGHSMGGIAAIHATADLLDRLPSEDQLGLITLGSNHGLILLQRGEGRDALAEAIAKITSDARVFWLDVSSPRDAFCVPLTDPLTLIDATPGLQSPRVISAQLAKAPKIPGDRRTVFAAMRRHMGYLLPPAQEGSFDYVDTVTGPQTLRQQFKARNNSPKATMWRA